MNTLPDFIEFEFGGKKCFVVHGSFDETSEYIFESTNWKIKSNNFNATQADIVIAGHSGLPFSQKHEQKFWLNPGVIGMPANDGTNRVWYMILDLDAHQEIQYEHKYFNYDHSEASRLMIECNLPKEYAKTIIDGIWDNCEILPDEETKKQGVPIDFDFQKT